MSQFTSEERFLGYIPYATVPEGENVALRRRRLAKMKATSSKTDRSADGTVIKKDGASQRAEPAQSRGRLGSILPSSITNKLASWFRGGERSANGICSANVDKFALSPTSNNNSNNGRHQSHSNGNNVDLSPQPRAPADLNFQRQYNNTAKNKKKNRYNSAATTPLHLPPPQRTGYNNNSNAYYRSLLRDDEGNPTGDAVRSAEDGLPIRDFIYASAVGRLYYSTRDEIVFAIFGFYHGQRVLIRKGPLRGLRVVIVGTHAGQLHGIFEGETEASPFLRCYNHKQLMAAYDLQPLTGARAVPLQPLTMPEDLPQSVHNFLQYAPDLTLEIVLNQNDEEGAAASATATTAAAASASSNNNKARKAKTSNTNRRIGKKSERDAATHDSYDNNNDTNDKKNCSSSSSSSSEDEHNREATLPPLPAPSSASSTNRRRAVGYPSLVHVEEGRFINNYNCTNSRRSISFADGPELEIQSPLNLIKKATSKKGKGGSTNKNGSGEAVDEDDANDWFLSREKDGGRGMGDDNDDDEEEDECDDGDDEDDCDEDEEEDDGTAGFSSHVTNNNNNNNNSTNNNNNNNNNNNADMFKAVNPFIPLILEATTPRAGRVVVYLAPTYALSNSGAVGWAGEAMQPISGAGNVRRYKRFNFIASSFIKAKKDLVARANAFAAEAEAAARSEEQHRAGRASAMFRQFGSGGGAAGLSVGRGGGSGRPSMSQIDISAALLMSNLFPSVLNSESEAAAAAAAATQAEGRAAHTYNSDDESHGAAAAATRKRGGHGEAAKGRPSSNIHLGSSSPSFLTPALPSAPTSTLLESALQPTAAHNNNNNNNSNLNTVGIYNPYEAALSALEVQKQMLESLTQPLLASISATVVVPLVLSSSAVDALAATVEDEGDDSDSNDEGGDAAAVYANSSDSSDEDGESQKLKKGKNARKDSTKKTDSAQQQQRHRTSTSTSTSTAYTYSAAAASAADKEDDRHPEEINQFLNKVVSASLRNTARLHSTQAAAASAFGIRSSFEDDLAFLASNQ